VRRSQVELRNTSAVHESGCGTFEAWRRSPRMSVYRGRPEVAGQRVKPELLAHRVDIVCLLLRRFSGLSGHDQFLNTRPLRISSTSECAQIVRHVTEAADHLGVSEVAGCGISAPAEGDRTDITRFARKRLRAHYNRVSVNSPGWVSTSVEPLDFGTEWAQV
jgi:hypothetical protein